MSVIVYMNGYDILPILYVISDIRSVVIVLFRIACTGTLTYEAAVYIQLIKIIGRYIYRIPIPFCGIEGLAKIAMCIFQIFGSFFKLNLCKLLMKHIYRLKLCILFCTYPYRIKKHIYSSDIRQASYSCHRTVLQLRCSPYRMLPTL